MLFCRFSATVSVLSLLPAVVLGNSGNCSDVSPSGIRHSTVPQITLPLRRESATPLPSLVSVRHPVSHVECIVKPLGFGRDDSAHILDAVALCGQGGTITLPAPYVYTVSQRLYMHLDHARLNVYGIMSFTPNLGYWIENSHRIGFQNQSTSWVISGNDFVVDGGGWQQGGIQGNGQAWYTRAQGRSNQFGRPIPLSIYNSTNVTITNFSVYEPQFWSFWIQDSSNIYLRGVYINGTNTDPAGNGSNYAINLDGVNTYRVDNLIMENSAFQGGDDCFTPKGNSTNIILKNITCVGGGIAFGSVGQYPGFPDYIANFTASEIHVAQNVHPLYGGAKVAGGAYFKSWVGFEAGEPPQGGGGGTGRVNNVTFHNLSVHNTTQAIFINKCYYKVAEQANYCDTSTFKFEDLSFYNISGTTSTSVGIALNCSVAAPCSNVAFSDVSLVQDLGNSTHTRCVNARNVTGVRCS